MSTPLAPARTSVHGRAAVSCSQPLASAAGLQVLAAGGCAADAAVAMAAMLAVVAPTSNGLGGDMIAIHHSRADGASLVLGAGASPAALTKSLYGQPPLSPASPHTVTVPGAVAAWHTLHSFHGSRTFSPAALLAPAARAARQGFYVHDVTAAAWADSAPFLRAVRADHPLLLQHQADDSASAEYRAPRAGELFRNDALASVLDDVIAHGPDAFYGGRVARAIVAAVRDAGGVLALSDLARHNTTVCAPLAARYADWDVLEAGAPTHGAVALLALQTIERVRARAADTGEGEGGGGCAGDAAADAHLNVEALRLAFAAVGAVVGDGEDASVATEALLDGETADALASRIRLDARLSGGEVGSGGACIGAGGTVQFCVIDCDGNAVSAVQSNYQGFGTGIVPRGCGFSLQNRGLNFCVTDGHPNCVGGQKRPYHTIMPGMLVRRRARGDADVVAFGVMGSFMQPQGHVQVVRALVDDGADAQSALDRRRVRATGAFSAVEPRFARDGVLVEAGTDAQVVDGLRRRGHEVVVTEEAECFGRGHVIVRRADGRVSAGAERRADGQALVWL